MGWTVRLISVSAYAAVTTIIVVNDSGTLDSGLSAVSYGLLSADNSSIPPMSNTVSGATKAATQAQQETGTSITVAVTPGTQVFHNSACKGWGKININGTAAGQSNISSVDDTGPGTATVNWAEDFADTTYCAVATCVFDPAGSTATTLTAQIYNTAYAAGTTRIGSQRASDGAGVDPSFYTIAAFGDRP